MDSAYFWMAGRMATGLIKLTNNPADIDDGFWAITTTFDGKFTGAKFKEVTDAHWNKPFKAIKSGTWRSSHSKEDYCKLVDNFRNEIARGNIYQANACRILSIESNESIEGLVAGFLTKNPAKYGGFLKIPGMEIASASPERFLSRDGLHIGSSPIKGTRKPGIEGPFPEKDQSENIMIVDLMRNDLGRICVEDSINVSHLLRIEELPGISHLVSDIEGELREGITWPEIFSATLPPGSVSGAPKSSAIKMIDKYENIDRGPYCGAFGWIHGARAELAVAIRTFWSDSQVIKFGTGAGITWGSVPESEWEETELKAARLISIATGELN